MIRVRLRYGRKGARYVCDYAGSRVSWGDFATIAAALARRAVVIRIFKDFRLIRLSDA